MVSPTTLLGSKPAVRPRIHSTRTTTFSGATQSLKEVDLASAPP